MNSSATAVRTVPLRLGTRSSALAMAQSQTVASAITEHSGRSVELVGISTSGDRSNAAIADLGGTGVFVSALREKLQRAEIDLAVHSYKDLPSAAEPGLVVAAIPARHDPRDVLISRVGVNELPAGARIGTGAPRRIAQLRLMARGWKPVPVRGNVDTRLAGVIDGHFDAVVLARAGMQRLGREGRIADGVLTEVLEPEVMLPAPAQGALAVECRTDDAALTTVLAALDHADSRATVTAERAMLAGLQASCTAPVAAFAEFDPPSSAAALAVPTLTVRGSVTALDGSHAVRHACTGPVNQADAIGRRLAAELLAAGAAPLL